MRIQGIEIPDELTEAIEENRLVVFAGAGVSMQPPDPLPDFTELVEGITHTVRPNQPKIPRIGNERYESYLGRIGEVAQLKEACAQIMSPGAPSDLHANILRLFEGGVLRLVTTNYDLRFETAAEALGMDTRSFSSPALPLGNDFDGIVHLHGDVTHPDELILVDSDYGSAYVSDGWVTRFLVKMFSRYMVLFVGYSLSDVPMQYLARSISGELQDRVFVLETEPNSFDKWRRRGITPIPFERYEQLPDLFHEWGRRVLRTQEQRMGAVARIAATHGSLTDYDSETLRKALEAKDSDEQRLYAQAFADAATGFESLAMLVEQGYDSFLFKDEATPRDEALRAWAAEEFVTSRYRELVLLAEEAHRPFCGRFQVLVMDRLARCDANDECLAFWASFLDSRAMGSSGLRARSLAKVIDTCQNDEVALAYIRMAFSTHAALERADDGAVPTDPHVRFDIDVTNGSEELLEAIFARAGTLSPQLLALCVSSLDRCDAIRTCHGLHVDDGTSKPTVPEASRPDAAEQLLVAVIRKLGAGKTWR
ncbi:MAG: SIR2 family protein [Atopobiaceae bacterium]|nr:SIR2 family protein [Atopobiaceae bacterium]